MNSDVMPVGHLTLDQVRTVMRACAAAPPVRNERPWRLVCTPTALELRAELPNPETSSDGSARGPAHSRADRSADSAARSSGDRSGPDGRELLLSCGAALLNVRATIKVLGAHPAVRLMPDENQPDLLAVVHPQAGSAAAPADLALAEAIAQRRTSQAPADGIPVPMINRLRQAARVEQTWLAILAPDQLQDVQLGHLDGGAQARGGTADDIGGASGRPAADRSNVVVAVVGSFHDSPLAWLQSGQGMQRVLLTADAAGLTTSLLSHAVRETRTRGLVRDLIGGGVWPQAVLRLECPAPSSAPRPASPGVPRGAMHRSSTR